MTCAPRLGGVSFVRWVGGGEMAGCTLLLRLLLLPVYELVGHEGADVRWGRKGQGTCLSWSLPWPWPWPFFSDLSCSRRALRIYKASAHVRWVARGARTLSSSPSSMVDSCNWDW